MTAPDIPDDESQRLALLMESGLLDSVHEAAFDDLAALAAELAAAPIALVSLVDRDRQWFKARVGLDAPETPREISLCGHVVFEREPLLVADATADDRFADNPLVTGAPHIRSYFGFPLAVEDGHVLGTLCAIDTERRSLSEAQIRQMGALARQVALIVQSRIDAHRSAWRAAVVQSSADAIISADLAGSIVAWNPAATELFGWTEAEAVGMRVEVLAPGPEDRERQRDVLGRVGRDNMTVMEAQRRHKDGRLIDVVLRVHPIMGASGDPIGVSSAIRDLTDYKKLERLEHDFISTISHELRTPLTSIRGAMGLVLGGAAGEVPDTARSMLEIAMSNSDRLLHLVNDILDVQVIESGRAQLDMRPTDLVDVLRESRERMSHLAASKDVTVVVSAAGPAQVSADPLRVSQVIDNLLSNALKFSPEGGQVTLGLGPVVVLPHGHRVTVADQGPGIPDEFRSRIFQRFAKADSEQHRHVPGTGLGLAISRTLVEMHGGTIGFRSVGGHGATFWFELPPGS